MSTVRGPVFAGNWKMHHSPEAARRFFADFLLLCPPRAGRTVLFFPPAVSLAAALEACATRPDIGLGVQNVFWEQQGAFTGEISPALAAEAGAAWVLVGHSERRHLFGETVADSVRKCCAALGAGLRVIVCVGETLEEREGGCAEQTVREQLEPVLQALPSGAEGRWMVAYEPVWAIGTGQTATPEDAQRMHAFIRELLRRVGADGDVLILYGGSVKPDNAAQLLACPAIDGVLVGGASLDPEQFARICEAGS